MNKYHPIPYDFFGVKLWAVEDSTGYIQKYCDTKQDAINHCEELNEKQQI